MNVLDAIQQEITETEERLKSLKAAHSALARVKAPAPKQQPPQKQQKQEAVDRRPRLTDKMKARIVGHVRNNGPCRKRDVCEAFAAEVSDSSVYRVLDKAVKDHKLKMLPDGRVARSRAASKKSKKSKKYTPQETAQAVIDFVNAANGADVTSEQIAAATGMDRVKINTALSEVYRRKIISRRHYGVYCALPHKVKDNASNGNGNGAEAAWVASDTVL